MKAITAIKLAGDAERVRLEHAQAITAIQQAAAVQGHVLANVQLANGVTTKITHGFKKAPGFISVSVPRGAASAGYINDIRTADRSTSIFLQANGYGATVTVDVWVQP